MDTHISNLLLQRLEKSDGRPLYRYKIGNETYDLLQLYLTTTELKDYNFLFWSGMFTLYAVEWWRREFDGGYWEWDPIFKSISLEYLNTPLTRQKIVNKGFKYWKREIQVNSNGKKTYLGTVYSECGIPNFALNDNHYLSDIIKQSFKKLSLVNLSEHDSIFIVKEIAEKRLPESLHRDVSYKLLKDVTKELINLKNRFNLGDKTNPSEYLDDKNPGWRENFPIQVSDIGNKFIDRLLSEVQKIETQTPHKIKLVHKLVNKNDTYDIRSEIIFPDKSLAFQSLNMDAGRFARFSNKAKILLSNNSGTRIALGYAFKNQDKGFRINIATNTKLPEKAFYENWQLILLDTSGHDEFQIEIPFSEALENEAPWIFALKNDSCILKAVGSSKLTNSEAFVLFSELSAIHGNYSYVGDYENRKIIKISENCQIIHDHNTYKIQLRADIDDNSYYKLLGQMFQYHRGEDLFIGLPKVQKVDKESLVKFFSNGNLQVKRNNSEGWVIPDTSFIGGMKLRFLGNENEVLLMKNINVLPKDFRIELGSEDEKNGRISLVGSTPFNISFLAGESLNGEITKTEDGHIIELYNLKNIKSEEATIELTIRDASSVKIDVPVPKESFNIYNKEGEVLDNNSVLHVEEMQGFRLSVYNNKSKPVNTSIRLELIDPRNSAIQINLNRKISIKEFCHKRKPLIDYLEDMQRLLSFGSLDARVKFSYGNHNISIRNYSQKRYFDETTQTFNIPNILNKDLLINAQTFRLDRPISNEDTFLLSYNEENSAWEMPEAFNGQGNWLIFPEKTSIKQFRPLLIIRESSVQELNEINAICEAGIVKDEVERIKLFSTLYDNVALDFSHSLWTELSTLWEITGHLPMKTFDVWTAISQSDAGLVTAFLMLKENAIYKLTEEFTINWLLIPSGIWINSIQEYKSYLERLIEDKNIVVQLINSFIERIKSELNLSFIGELVEYTVLEKDAPQGFMLNEFILKSIISDDIKGQENRPGLVGRHGLEGEWPDALQKDIVDFFYKLPKEIKELFPKDLISYSKSVTYLPAIFAVHSVDQEIFRLNELDYLMRYRLNQIIEFDQEWHYNVFNYVQGYYWKLIYN